jgi:hypothetical protein
MAEDEHRKESQTQDQRCACSTHAGEVMMKRMTFIAAVLVLGGCSQSLPVGDSYFPLPVGATWEYDVTSDINNIVSHETYTLSVDRTIDTDAGEVIVRRAEAAGSIGIEYWLRKEKDRIVRIAQRIDADEQAKLDRNPQVVLKLPVTVGASWMVPTDLFVIAPKYEMGMGTTKMPKVLLTYTVEAIDETVAVEAGTFKSCARVAGVGNFALYVDAVQGFRDIPVVNREWYCKGVGLVKVERTELLQSAYYSSGKITMALTEFKLP